MHIRVITGTYTEDIVHHDQSIIYTDWNDSSFGWSRNTTPFYYNDIIMGALSDFANVFSFEIILLDETTYSIINDKGDELILSNDSYIAQFNGQTKNLTYPTIHKFSLNSSDGVLFIPLQLIAELMGLYTYENTNDGYNNHCLWLSECSILNGDEFIPNDNYLSLGMTTEPSYTDGLVNFNEYDLKEDGCTYSGIRIGDSYDEVISILGAPQTQKIQNDITGGINEQIYYDLNPDANYDYPDYIGFYFSDGVLEEVLLRIYIWDN
jgi:hypothetical protein